VAVIRTRFQWLMGLLAVVVTSNSRVALYLGFVLLLICLLFNLALTL